ncbi:MAG: hypothetical protein HY903_07115 [Deltaproteobacteria bacterium]|nr:hypothetical protein [Deltaproteobacteria bacterium]
MSATWHLPAYAAGSALLHLAAFALVSQASHDAASASKSQGTVEVQLLAAGAPPTINDDARPRPAALRSTPRGPPAPEPEIEPAGPGHAVEAGPVVAAPVASPPGVGLPVAATGVDANAGAEAPAGDGAAGTAGTAGTAGAGAGAGGGSGGGAEGAALAATEACWRTVTAELDHRARSRVPRALLQRGLDGVVAVLFSLSARGEAQNVRFEAVTGSPLLVEAVRAILAEPFARSCGGERRWRVRFRLSRP